ncbi:MAG: hypothetical protein COA58_04400 [Bacteroidetes bacterium]|nr:MAG: hypothetical protein COA58_04400 [Bacteroidota bacterium]
MDKEKNVFDQLGLEAKMPKSAKAEVMDKLAAAKLVLDFWDLFAPKRIAVNLNTLNQTHANKKKNKKKK